jgi:tetratricopeptide (TPR) repeat protein
VGPRDPHVPDSVQASDLDRVTLNSLRTLPEGLAEIVARHLVAASALLADDPQAALEHARAAARRAGRVAVVREAVGVAAYAAGDFAAALSELRAAARISGSSEYLPMMADCERGLGRPERALALASTPEAATLDRDGKVEMLIVAAGARRDLGQPEAAVLTLQVPALKSRATGQWLARLRYAYADALAEVGRNAEARAWFLRAAEVDPEGLTDAVERLDELDGITFEDDLEDDLGAVAGLGSEDGSDRGGFGVRRGSDAAEGPDVGLVEGPDDGPGKDPDEGPAAEAPLPPAATAKDGQGEAGAVPTDATGPDPAGQGIPGTEPAGSGPPQVLFREPAAAGRDVDPPSGTDD